MNISLTHRRNIILSSLLFILAAEFSNAEDTRSRIFLDGAGGDATADRSLSSAPNLVEIQTSTDSSRAILQTGRTYSTKESKIKQVCGNFTDKKQKDCVAQKNARFSTLLIRLSAPLNKEGENTDLGTLNSQQNDTRLSFNYSRFIPNATRNPALSIANNYYDEICALTNSGYRASDDYDPDTPNLDSCFELNNVQKYAPEKFESMKSLFWAPSGIYKAYGVGGSIGYQDFDYRDTQTLEDRETDEISWSVEAYYGLYPYKWKTMFVVSGEYQEGHKSQASRTVCPSTANESSVLECVTGNFGAPQDDDRKIIAFEARRAIRGVGASLKISRDFEQDVTGIDMPLHMFENKKGGLNGGIRFGWRSDTDDLTVGLFVSASSFKVLTSPF